MEVIFEESKPKSIQLSDKEIFTKIWMSPRLVFRYIQEHNYSKFTTGLLILGGITSVLNNASNRHLGDLMPLWSVLIVCVLGGGIFGWLYFYIYAALLSWTGKWLKGAGNTKSLFLMISYALIPSLVVLFVLIVRIVLFGNEEFQSNLDILGKGFLTISLYGLSAFVEIAIGVWTLAILVIGISEVQKLSIWKSILNLILPGILIIAVLLPLGAIGYILRDFFR
ncbi:MAG: Yip1 family protein [Paludibacter sp.]|nr:Yip1 family protein [Paludibacter sp.]